jgi:hypothetical protein
MQEFFHLKYTKFWEFTSPSCFRLLPRLSAQVEAAGKKAGGRKS